MIKIFFCLRLEQIILNNLIILCVFEWLIHFVPLSFHKYAIASNLKQKKILITETNLPEKQNLSYFGKNDQAHWIYNFSLPPLIIKSLLFENGSELTKWSKKFPSLKKELVI